MLHHGDNFSFFYTSSHLFVYLWRILIDETAHLKGSSHQLPVSGAWQPKAALSKRLITACTDRNRKNFHCCRCLCCSNVQPNSWKNNLAGCRTSFSITFQCRCDVIEVKFVTVSVTVTVEQMPAADLHSSQMVCLSEFHCAGLQDTGLEMISETHHKMSWYFSCHCVEV